MGDYPNMSTPLHGVQFVPHQEPLAQTDTLSEQLARQMEEREYLNAGLPNAV